MQYDKAAWQKMGNSFTNNYDIGFVFPGGLLLHVPEGHDDNLVANIDKPRGSTIDADNSTAGDTFKHVCLKPLAVAHVGDKDIFAR